MSDALLERIPPQAQEAEQAALGAMLLERQAIERADEMLQPDDFYREAHRVIYQGIQALYRSNSPVDLITLGTWLKEHDKLEAIGGTLYLTTVMSQVPTASGITHYCGIIRARAMQRALIRAADEIMTAAYQGEKDMDELLQEAEQAVYAISDRQSSSEEPILLEEHLKSVFYRLEDLINADEGDLPGVRSGWDAQDRILRPLAPGQMAVVGARPKMGKTAYGVGWCLHLAEQGIPCCVFSMEMEGEEVTTRALLAKLQITSDQLADIGFCRANRDAVLADMAHSVERLYGLPLWIDDRPGLTVDQIGRTIRRLKRKGLQHVLVDFMQLASPGSQKRNQAEEIGAIAYGLAGLAKQYDVSMVSLAQLNRDVEKESPRRPQSHHFEGSGRIEQAAHRLMYLYRPGYYGEQECGRAGVPGELADGLTEVGLLRSRNSKTGKTFLWFDGAKYRFRDPRADEWAQLARYQQGGR